jgi:hypothetical protein
VRLSEEVVEVAEDVLVGPDEAEREVVGLRALEGVEREELLDVAQVDELLDLAVRVAGDVGERRDLARLLAQPVDREDREELVDRPRIGDRLEDREIDDVLVGELALEVLELLRDLLQALEVATNPVAGVPEEDLPLRAVLQRDVAEVEEGEELLLVLERVV